ncbi:hypothetical protein NQZ68_002469 [Dissostichus eleginoides]|nr:hypothetical protein NQZ68_002469 [Dissostichus eleginoides]
MDVGSSLRMRDGASSLKCQTFRWVSVHEKVLHQRSDGRSTLRTDGDAASMKRDLQGTRQIDYQADQGWVSDINNMAVLRRVLYFQRDKSNYMRILTLYPAVGNFSHGEE